MMLCYYWQKELCTLYPAFLTRPCFLCFQNGSPHPLSENQCYQKISKKKMVVAFWHLTMRIMLKWSKQDTSNGLEWPEGDVGGCLSKARLSEQERLSRWFHYKRLPRSFGDVYFFKNRSDYQEGHWNYSLLWCLLLLQHLGLLCKTTIDEM